MANVFFKRGSQAKLNELSSYVEGSFYLTNDTDRLYFAQSASELVALNQFIRTVESLPKYQAGMEVGDIYYIPSENILAIINAVYPDYPEADRISWSQLNPDTYLASNTSNTSVSSDNGTVTISNSISDSAGHYSRGSFQIIGGGSAVVTASGNSITISVPTQATYALSAEENDDKEVILSLDKTVGETATNVGEVGIAAGDGIKVSVEEGQIVISNTFAEGIYSIDDGINKKVTAGFNDIGAFTVSVEDGADTKTSTAITPEIKYGHQISGETVVHGSTATFNSGSAIIDIYTADEVDAAINKALAAADAMTYKGLVGLADYDEKLLSNANVGDTYKVSSDFYYNGNVKASIGDLIIASGADGNVTWEVVHSAGDQVIEGAVTNNTFTISDNGTILAAGKVEGTDKITVTANTTGKSITYTAKHDKLEATATVNTQSAIDQNNTNTITITAVTGVTVDEYGHVSGWEATPLTLVDTHNALKKVDVSTAVDDNIVTVTTNINMSDDSKQDSISITSSTLKFTATTNALNCELEWGSF